MRHSKPAHIRASIPIEISQRHIPEIVDIYGYTWFAENEFIIHWERRGGYD